jgi:hypothetical protein
MGIVRNYTRDLARYCCSNVIEAPSRLGSAVSAEPNDSMIAVSSHSGPGQLLNGTCPFEPRQLRPACCLTTLPKNHRAANRRRFVQAAFAVFIWNQQNTVSMPLLTAGLVLPRHARARTNAPAARSSAADRAIYPSPEGGDALGSVRVGDFGSGR